MTRIGTCYFISMAGARRYYADQDCSAADVVKMIEDGTIIVGRPAVATGQTLELVDGGTRWAIIEEKDAVAPGQMLKLSSDGKAIDDAHAPRGA